MHINFGLAAGHLQEYRNFEVPVILPNGTVTTADQIKGNSIGNLTHKGRLVDWAQVEKAPTSQELFILNSPLILHNN